MCVGARFDPAACSALLRGAARFARQVLQTTHAPLGAAPPEFDGMRVRVHAYKALSDRETHCPHAGPDGDGVCESGTDAIAGTCGALLYAARAPETAAPARKRWEAVPSRPMPRDVQPLTRLRATRRSGSMRSITLSLSRR